MRLPPAAWIAFCAVVAALGLATQVAWPIDETNRLRDDAFYVFSWAREAGAGRDPMVSLGVTTSGVQWLWAFALSVLARLGVGDELPRIAAALGASLHVLTAALWARSGADRAFSLGLGLLWLGHPLLLRECVNGQETALACLAASCLWLFRRCEEPAWFALGILASLARTDLLGVVLLLSLFRGGRFCPGALLTPVAAFAAHAWLALSYGGGILQDSGAPMAWLFHANFAALDPSIGEWLLRQWWFARPALLGHPFALVSAPALGFAAFLLARPFVPRCARWALLALAGAGAWAGASDLSCPFFAAVFLGFWPRERRGSRAGLRRVPFAALCAGLYGIVLLHWAVRWYPRDYYLAPLAVAALAALGKARRLPLVLVAAVAWQVGQAFASPGEDLRGQEEMAMAGRFLDRLIPRSEQIASFNSGILGWLRGREGGSVANLDGVVDHRAFGALRTRSLSAWLDEARIRFVVDSEVQFSVDPALPHACGRWFGRRFDPRRDLVEIARFDVPWIRGRRPGTDSVRLYWRRGAWRPPESPRTPEILGPRARGGVYLLWPARAGQVLEAESRGGGRTALAVATADSAQILAIDRDRLGSGRLFIRGHSEPLLVVPGL